MKDLLKERANLLVPAVLLIIGLVLGHLAGMFWSGRFMRGQGGGFMVMRPSTSFMDIYMHLNSPNPFARTGAYYSLAHLDVMDREDLLTRYREERFPVLKRAILWSLGERMEKETYADLCFSLLEGREPPEVRLVLSTLRDRYPCSFPGMLEKRKDKLPDPGRPGIKVHITDCP
jgi:hypothetical protein